MPPPAFSVCVFVGLCCMCLKALHNEVLLSFFAPCCLAVLCIVMYYFPVHMTYNYASRISLFSRGSF